MVEIAHVWPLTILGPPYININPFNIPWPVYIWVQQFLPETCKRREYRNLAQSFDASIQ